MCLAFLYASDAAARGSCCKLTRSENLVFVFLHPWLKHGLDFSLRCFIQNRRGAEFGVHIEIAGM